MKRSLIVIIVTLLIAAVAAFIFFKRDKVIFSKDSSLYKAVPLSTPLFVEANSLRAIPTDNPVLEELAAIDDFGWVMNQVDQITEQISENDEIQKSWARRPVIVAFDFVGEDKLVPVIISAIKNADELNGMERLLNKLSGTDGSTPQERKYSGHKIFSIRTSTGKSLHFCAAGGLIIISPESILIDKSLRQLNSENLTDIRNFNRVNKTVDTQSDASWYINHQRFPNLFTKILNSTTQTSVNEFGETIKRNLRRDVLKLSDYAGWSELDMAFHDNRVSMNGITVADDSLNHFVTIFNGQEAESFQCDKILPKNTAFYIGFTFSNRDLFFENLIEYFKHSNAFYEREDLLKKMERRLGDDSRTTLRNLLDNQVVAAITDISDDHTTTLFAVKIHSRKDAQAALEQMMQNYAQSKEVEFSSLHYNVSTDDGKNNRVYRFPYPSLPGAWLGETFAFAQANFATLYDDFIVFASSEKAMKDYLSDMALNYSLNEDRDYSDFERAAESKSNINVYANINRALPLNTHIFNTNFSKRIDENGEVLRQFEAISWQLVCEKEVYFNSLNLAVRDKPSGDGRAMWACDLGAPLIGKPQFVTNHNTKDKEIIVQDTDNRLHLVSSGGSIVWTIPISGKILSDIHQVDLYRNGNLQYLFNTADKLYLIDRNGNNVSGFPVVFESQATNGVNVFDYDNNRKYRYFVACKNRKVYCLDQNGKVVNGWEFGQTESTVTTPVQHFRVNNRDYIVFKDAGRIYVQDRRGSTRVNVSARFENSNNPLVLNLDGTPKIVATDKNGKVFYLYFDGKYAEKSDGGLSENHGFTTDDLDGNKVPDFIFTDGNKLKVTDENGKTLYNEKLDNTLSAPNVYTFSAQQKMVGITDTKENHIYLFTPDGKQYKGFPFKGNSAFSIGTMAGQMCLVVGNDDEELVCYGL